MDLEVAVIGRFSFALAMAGACEPPFVFPAADSPAKDEGFVAARASTSGVRRSHRAGAGMGLRVAAFGFRRPDESGFLCGGGERVKEIRYFKCPPLHGAMVRPDKVKVGDSAERDNFEEDEI
ncbi:hypothetical protein NL676_037112 [Syzygium grande]|nr:hypothetical protein NL676_037112 [Syzygium grande]